MTITTYDKNGNPNNVRWANVKKIKLFAIPLPCYDAVTNLQMTLSTGEVVDYYLSRDERFAVIEET